MEFIEIMSTSAKKGATNVCIIEIPENATVYSYYDLSTMKSWGVVVINNELLYQGNWEYNNFVDIVTVVSMKENKLVSVYSIKDNEVIENVKRSDVYIGTCLLNDGEIVWEGEMVNDNACGYGSIYTSANRILTYKGFRVVYNNVCFGEYYQSGQPLYKGIICNDKRFGIDHFSQHQYIDDKCITSVHLTIDSDASSTIPSLIQSLTISNFMFNTSSHFILTCFPNLESLDIGERCYCGDGVCSISSLPRLTTLSFGNRSFMNISSVKIQSRGFQYLINRSTLSPHSGDPRWLFFESKPSFLLE